MQQYINRILHSNMYEFLQKLDIVYLEMRPGTCFWRNSEINFAEVS